MIKKSKDINLKTLINSLKKEFGSDIELFSESVEGDLLKLGNKAIDKMLYGGLPFGHLHEFFGLSQTGKCVTPDTYLFNPERGFAMIDDIIFPSSGYNIITGKYFTKLRDFLPTDCWWELEKEITIEGKIKPEKVNKLYFAKNEKVIRIITKSGFTIAGTYDHKIETIDSSGKVIDTELNKIKKGDSIKIQLPHVLFCEGTNKLPKYEPVDDEALVDFHLLSNLPHELTNDLVSLIVLLLSFYEYKDGRLQMLPARQFTLNRISQERVNKARRMLMGRLIDYNDYTEGISQQLIPYFMNLGLHLTFPMGARFIPYTILQAKKEKILRFILDYMALNGRMEKNKFSVFSFSFYILYFIKLYLESLGIQSKGFYTSSDEDKSKKYINVITPFQMTRLSLKFDKINLAKLLSIVDTDFIEENYPSKYSSMVEYCVDYLDDDLSYAKITNDEVFKIQKYRSDVLDIEMPEQHKYLANGFVSHNSFFLQKALANAQKQYPPTIGIILDREKAYTKKRAEFLGIETDKVILAKPASIPTAIKAKDFILDTIKRIRDKDKDMQYHIVVLIDSLAAFMPKGLKGEDMGKKAKEIHSSFRELLTIDSKTMVLFSNHVTFNPNAMFTNPKTKACGTAPDYLRTCGIALDAKKPIKEDGKQIGVWLEVVVDKTRRGPSFSRTVVPFYFKTGVPEWGGYDRYLVFEGILRPSSKAEYKKLISNNFKYIYKDQETNKEIAINAGNEQQLKILCKKYNL